MGGGTYRAETLIMADWSRAITTEGNPQTSVLRARLDRFYDEAKRYSDFQLDRNDKPEFWKPVRERIGQIVADRGSCRVLEFGAGRTGFGSSLGALRDRVTFTAQDVTPRNRPHLESQADSVFIGDVRGLDGPFDVVFSTFVWEHVSHPESTLKHLLVQLSPGGSLFLASPRYDMPGYIPPSARHYGTASRSLLSCWLTVRRVRTLVLGRPAFLVHTDPAALNGPWFRDADAVHWASLFDLKAAVPPGFRLERLRLQASGWKRRIWERWLLLFVRIDRDRNSYTGNGRPAPFDTPSWRLTDRRDL